MLNIRLKNLFIVLFLLTSLTLTFGCSKMSDIIGSQPSWGEMKSKIFNLTKNEGQHIFNVSFREFKITKDFMIKKNGEEWYCIEINYRYEYDYNRISSDGRLSNQTEHFSYRKDHDRFSFTKREDKWYGQKGWVN
jgi:hypothetical protein